MINNKRNNPFLNYSCFPVELIAAGYLFKSLKQKCKVALFYPFFRDQTQFLLGTHNLTGGQHFAS